MAKFRFTETYDLAERKGKKPRVIIVLMDGTWNDETGKDGDGVVTNIVKLFRCLDERSDTQAVRYFRGVGNDEENDWWGILRGGAFGKSEGKIRENAYSTIAKEYRPGDRIVIFGFSRGAASARLLASDLHKKGIPDRISITTEPRQNCSTGHVENRYVEFRSEGEKHDVEVEFLGVWDTVGAFGIPVTLMGIPFQKLNLFRDMHIAPNIRKAIHLVSIDETREAFEPTLMNHKPEVVEEIWLPGVHSDVGGGYSEDQLGRLSLKLMIDRLTEHFGEVDGFAIDFKPEVVRRSVEDDDEACFHFHGLGFKKSIRQVFVQSNDKPAPDQRPKVHSSVSRLQQSRQVFGVARKKRLFRRKKEARIHIIYNPINVKALEGQCDFVE